MLAQFQSLYPEGSIISELIQIHHNKYIVRVNVQIKGVTRVTGMAAAETIEMAEDRARERALMVLKKASLQETSSQDNSANLSLQGQGVQVQSHRFDTTETLDQLSVKQVTAKQEGTTETAKTVNQSSAQEESIAKAPIPKEAVARFESIHSDSQLTTTATGTNTAQAKEESNTAIPVSSHPSSRFTVNSNIPPQEIKQSKQINQSDFDSQGVTNNSQFQFDSPLGDDGTGSSENQADINQLPLMSSTNVQSFMSPSHLPPEEEQEVTASIKKKPTKTSKKKTEPKDSTSTQPKSLLDPIAEIDVEMRRLGWTREQGREHLIQTYGKRARSLLTDEQLLEFLEYLKSQPTPLDPLDPGF